MKTYKELLNEWTAGNESLHKVTPDEMKALRAVLLDMLRDIQNLCVANGLTIMLGGGSCLGAIRHQGFIPWDDDLDLNMPRPDYNKLLDLLKAGALGPDYEFAYPDGKMESSSAFLKIYKKNTRFITIGNQNAPYPKGVFIDVFPLEGVSKYAFVRKIKGFFANSLRLIGNCVAEYLSQDADNKVNYSQELNKMLRYRRIIGIVFSFFPYRRWAYWYDRLVADDNMNGLIGAPAGRKLYNGEIHDKSVFFPVDKAVFEGIEVNVPNDVYAYLVKLFGEDYMQLPSVEKRESHFVVEIKL